MHIAEHDEYRVESDGKEMADQYDRFGDDACKQADRTFDAHAAELKVFEAALLESTEMVI